MPIYIMAWLLLGVSILTIGIFLQSLSDWVDRPSSTMGGWIMTSMAVISLSLIAETLYVLYLALVG
jgi:hypothetical protein